MLPARVHYPNMEGEGGTSIISDHPGTGVDGLLSQDREDLVERVAYLEKKVTQQEDEIVCLKSAMADVIRRLGQLEASNQKENSLLPSKPAYRTVPPKRPVNSPRLPQRPHSALENVNMVGAVGPPSAHRTTKALGSTGSSTPIKKWASMSGSAEMANSQLTATSSREPAWNAEEASLKIYLKGRAINLFAPADVTEFQVAKPGELPAEKLQLEWVYGYRGRDCRSNLYYLPTGELVYFAAAVVVLYNVEEGTQRHYLGHTDDVKCLAVHPDKIRIATGQVAGHERKDIKRKKGGSSGDKGEEVSEFMPHVRIWDSVSLHTLHVLGLGDFDRAVCCISFSTLDSGQHLVAVDESNEHSISLWDLSRDKPHKITETKSSTEPVLAVEFHPSEKGSIVSCGKGQITFWTFEGGALAKKQGIYDKHEKPKFVLCLAFAPNGDVLSGDSNGSIFVWGKGTNKISQAVTGAHAGGVFSLCFTKEGGLLSGGGKDRKIIEWDSNYTKTGREAELSEAHGPVRTLAQGKGGLILVGTTKNCILQGSLDLEFSSVMQGHTDETWGLASHPSQHQFLTCAYDRHVYLWDSQSRSAVWVKELNDGAHSCCFHPDGGVVAIGTQAARWVVLDLATHEIVTVHTDGSEQIECISYSPNGENIAVGSRDNYIYVYQVSEGGRKYHRVGRCSGHSSFITHIDWTVDNQYFVSNSGDYELLYWSASSCKQVTNPATLREMKFATQTCILSFNTAGIWPEGADGTDINGCNRNHKSTLLATADDYGKVNLFQYPCSQPKSPCHSYKGHSSHVTNVTFVCDDSRVITTGGRDMAILQWQVV